MNGEIIRLLDEALANKQRNTTHALHERASAQADAWSRLGKRWKGRGLSQKDIAALYKARSRGRSVSL